MPSSPSLTVLEYLYDLEAGFLQNSDSGEPKEKPQCLYYLACRESCEVISAMSCWLPAWHFTLWEVITRAWEYQPLEAGYDRVLKISNPKTQFLVSYFLGQEMQGFLIYCNTTSDFLCPILQCLLGTTGLLGRLTDLRVPTEISVDVSLPPFSGNSYRRPASLGSYHSAFNT